MSLAAIAACPTTDAERRTLLACRRGEELVLNAAPIRAVYLRALLAGGAAPLGLRLRGAIIDGRLDLSQLGGETRLPPLSLVECVFKRDVGADPRSPDIDISNARLSHLSLKGSKFYLLRGSHAQIGGALDLSHVAPAQTVPRPAWPGIKYDQYNDWLGRLEVALRTATSPPPRPAAPQNSPPQYVGQQCCYADLSHASIEGSLYLKEARFAAPQNKPALILRGARLSGSLEAQKLFCEGAIQLENASIGADLNMNGAALRAGEKIALDARSARVGGFAYFMKDGDVFSAFGEIAMHKAVVAGSVNFRAAYLDVARAPKSPEDTPTALNLQSIEIGGDLQLRNAFTCIGQVWLFGARIGRTLNLEEARVESSGKDTIVAETAQVAGLARFCDAIVIGGLEISDIRIGQHLNLQGAVLHANAGKSLCMDNAFVGSSLKAKPNKTKSFVATGTVSLYRARFGANVQFVEARLGEGLALAGAQIEGALRLKSNTAAKEFDLSAATCAELDDDANGYGSGDLKLSGFSYGHFTSPDFGAGAIAKRLEWLGKSTLRPQAYTRAARVLSEQGHDDDAREVLYELEKLSGAESSKQVWAAGRMKGFARCLVQIAHDVFGCCFGYGVKPTRAVASVACSLIAGTLFFLWVFERGAVVVASTPSAGAVAGTQFASVRLDTIGAAFDIQCSGPVTPYLYALDVFVPLLDLRQESACEIGEPEAQSGKLLEGFNIGNNWRLFAEADVYEFIKALYALWGWICTSLAILTFSGVFSIRPER